MHIKSLDRPIKIWFSIKSRINRFIKHKWAKWMTLLEFKFYKVHYTSFRTVGRPYMKNFGKISIGDDFSMNNGVDGNPIGCYNKCTFYVSEGSEIIIGNNVGISQTALISYCSIKIGDNVKIGGGTSIFTTDFHSLSPDIRKSEEDMANRVCKPVTIEDNAFIGAYCIILKGITIGENAIVGAGSVVTKDIPANTIWGGNPAKFIKNVEI